MNKTPTSNPGFQGGSKAEPRDGGEHITLEPSHPLLPDLDDPVGKQTVLGAGMLGRQTTQRAKAQAPIHPGSLLPTGQTIPQEEEEELLFAEPELAPSSQEDPFAAPVFGQRTFSGGEVKHPVAAESLLPEPGVAQDPLAKQTVLGTSPQATVSPQPLGQKTEIGAGALLGSHTMQSDELPAPSLATQASARFAALHMEDQSQTQTGTVSRNTTALPRIVSNQEGSVELVQTGEERYESIHKLGEGGAGEVTLVKDHDIHRVVAMKRIHNTHKNPAHLVRFVEEIQTVGQLEHPNIVPIYDVGLDDEGSHYFTMKYVQGETLESIIEKLRKGDKDYHKRYSYERRSQIFLEILHAIHFAHKHGYIHRDIKPANIMVGEYGEVQVMDWGIAKRIRNVETDLSVERAQELGFSEELAARLEQELGGPRWEDRIFQTQNDNIVGTPAYMAPEQALGEALDERTDLYSLTVLFYEFVNLHHYLAHKRTIKQLFMGLITEDPVDSEKLSNPHQGPVPREICFFLRKGLKKNPADRFQNIEEMLEEVQANLEGKNCVYCPSTFLKRSAHEYGRYLDNHRIFGVVVFCLALIVFGIGVYQASVWIATLL